MESGTLGSGHNPWGIAMFRTLKTVEPHSAVEQAAYGKWLDQRTDRESARADRTHGGEGVIPTPLWIVLFLSAVIIFVFMLFFADSAERVIVQATMMGSVAVVITTTLLLLWFREQPGEADERDRAEQRGYTVHGSSKKRDLSSSRRSFSVWRSW